MSMSTRVYTDPNVGGSDEFYLKKMEDILCHRYLPRGVVKSPTRLMDWLYIGNYGDASNHKGLQENGITHVLNCAAFRRDPFNPYPHHVGIVGYLQFDAQDCVDYNMLQHFPKARAFIDGARMVNGRVLVHCAAGINRCGIICTAYMMVDQKWDLLSTVAFIKSKRTLFLCNRGFRSLLVQFARRQNLLKGSVADLKDTDGIIHYLPAK